MQKISRNNIAEAVNAIRAGQLVAFPTETVYGLGGDACSDDAVAAIFAMKGRPSFNPLIVHVANREIAEKYVEFTSQATMLAEAFFPAPLTLVLKRRVDCPLSLLVSAGLDTVAIRIPAHPLAQEMLREFGGGVAAPSANRSGRVSPTIAQHVRDEFDGQSLQPAFIIDGGACEQGLESTVVYCADEDNPLVILRSGTITQEQLQQIIPNITIHKGEGVNQPSSPGMLSSHYAPNASLRLNAYYVDDDESLLAFGDIGALQANKVLNLSASGDLSQAAANLFAYLRELDSYGVDKIAIMPIPNEGVGVAINDRLQRAATPRGKKC